MHQPGRLLALPAAAADPISHAPTHPIHCPTAPTHCSHAAPVRACGLAEDCRHLLAVLGKGFVFRFEALGQLATAPAADSSQDGGGEGKENDGAQQQQAGSSE